MVRKLVLAAVAGALVLVVAPAASAKGPIEACGASGCAFLGPEGQSPIRLFSVDGATPTLSPATPAPYFVIQFGDRPGGSALAYWIPSASVLRVQGQPWRWIASLPSEDALLTEATAGLQPYAPPARPSVYVGYEPVKRSDVAGDLAPRRLPEARRSRLPDLARDGEADPGALAVDALSRARPRP